jgi:site-specific recombinase XerD
MARANQRFHRSDLKYRESAPAILDRAVEAGTITIDDAHLIREFVAEKSCSSNLSPSRIYKLYGLYAGWRQFIGPFRQNNMGDLYDGIDRLKQAKKPDGQPRYTQNTQGDYVKALKRFYLWLIDEEYASPLIKRLKVQNIQAPSPNTMTKTAEMMLTPDEVGRIIGAAHSLRDKALIALLYEGGLRIGEIGDLKWEAVKFSDWNVAVNVNAKTEKPRFIPVVMARPFLSQWRSVYPGDPTGSEFVFVTNRGLPLQYNAVTINLSLIARRAGVEKKITPHIFRHSRCTHLLREGYPESIIKKMLWGNDSTNMLATYGHLVDSDIEREVAMHNGITTAEHQRDTSLDPVQCTRCYSINTPTARYCNSCGLELTADAVHEKQSAEEQIWSDPAFRAAVEEAVRRVAAKST